MYVTSSPYISEIRESEITSGYMFNSLSHFLKKNCNFQNHKNSKAQNPTNDFIITRTINKPWKKTNKQTNKMDQHLLITIYRHDFFNKLFKANLCFLRGDGSRKRRKCNFQSSHGFDNHSKSSIKSC